MHQVNLQQLLSKVVLNAQEWNELPKIPLREMRAAVYYLEAHGVTPAQVQWLLETPFSRFQDHHVEEVMLMVVALVQGAITPADLHQILQERELWAQMHNATTLFATEVLPTAADIDTRLGMTPPQEPAAQPPLRSPARLPLPAIDTGAGDLFF